MDLLKLDNDGLRRFIQSNQVSFPAEAPVFRGQPRADIGWRLALLYFVRCWSLSRIADRYSFTRERAGQIVKQWWVEAVRSGYIQEVPPDPMRPLDGDLMPPSH
jgi:hypothetical protein